MPEERAELIIAVRDEVSAQLAKMGKSGAKAGNDLEKGLSGALKAATGLDVATLGLVGGLTALGAGLAYSVKQAAEAERIMALTQAVIKSTGGAAGLTAGQIGDMANRLSNLNAVDDETIQSAENLLLTFKNIKANAFEPATQAAIDLSVALGMSLHSAAMMVGKALEDPVRGMNALRRAGVSFTADQQKVIKSLVETGQSAKAQEMILAELNSQVGGAGVAAAKTYSGQMALLKINVDNLAESIGMRLLPPLTKVAAAMNDTVTVQQRYDKALEEGALSQEDIMVIRLADMFGLRQWGLATLEAAEASYAAAKAMREESNAIEDGQMFRKDFNSESKHGSEVQEELAQKTALTGEAFEKMGRQAGGSRKALEDLTGTAEILAAGLDGVIGQAQADYYSVLKETTPEIEKLTAQIAKYQSAQGQSYTVTEDATTSAAEYELATIKAAVALKKFTDYTGDNREEQLKLQVAADKAQEAVNKLGEGFGFTKEYTLDYTKKIAEANGTLGELNAKQAEAEAALKRTTAEFIYQKIAADLDAESALLVAEKLGLIDPASVAAIKSTQELRKEFDDGKISAEDMAQGAKDIADAIASLTSKHIEITIDTIRNERINTITTNYLDNTYGAGGPGSVPTPPGPGSANGADFVVPPGYPNDSYPMRVQSGEHVKVTPAGENTRDGPAVVQNIYTSAPVSAPALFQISQAIAGGW